MKRILLAALLSGAGGVDIGMHMPSVEPAYKTSSDAYVCVPDREAEQRHLEAIFLMLGQHNAAVLGIRDSEQFHLYARDMAQDALRTANVGKRHKP